MKGKRIEWEIKICYENTGIAHHSTFPWVFYTKKSIQGHTYLVSEFVGRKLKFRWRLDGS